LSSPSVLEVGISTITAADVFWAIFPFINDPLFLIFSFASLVIRMASLDI
jgi:hypothetical protein